MLGFCFIPPCEPTKMRSKADGVPPLCTWPKMVTRVSKPKFLTTSFDDNTQKDLAAGIVAEKHIKNQFVYAETFKNNWAHHTLKTQAQYKS